MLERKDQIAEDRPDCYLIVDQTGQIIADRIMKAEYDEHETWSCRYKTPGIRLQSLFPTVEEPRTAMLDHKSRQVIDERISNHMLRLAFYTKHEAGHAVLRCALRLTPTHAISVRPYPYLKGNLHDWIKQQRVVQVGFSRGATAAEVGWFVEDNESLLKWACYTLGGIAACSGDKTGAEDDLQKYVFFISELSNSEIKKEPRLQRKLKGLAQKIVTDGTILPRRHQLAEELRRHLFLSQEAIEEILIPASLPDYSQKIIEIGKEFNLI